MTTTGPKIGNKINKLFSAGLGRGPQLAAWGVAIGLVSAWKFYENRDNGEAFSKDEQEEWNKSKKGTAPAADK